MVSRPQADIRDLQIGLRVRDRVRVRVSNFKPVRFLESSLYMLVFRDEMGLRCDNVEPAN